MKHSLKMFISFKWHWTLFIYLQTSVCIFVILFRLIAHFKLGFNCFIFLLLLIFLSSVYILYINPLLNVSFEVISLTLQIISSVRGVFPLFVWKILRLVEFLSFFLFHFLFLLQHNLKTQIFALLVSYCIFLYFLPMSVLDLKI